LTGVPSHVEVKESVVDVQHNQPPVLVGDALLSRDLTGYNLHFPYRAGDLNLHPGIGGSGSSLLVDLEAIWSHIISEDLGIARQDFKQYKVILIVPAGYRRQTVKQLIHLLLTSLHFQAAFPIQEDVAATFGTGNPAACVVDIGHDVTKVSCVEDAVSHPSSRMCLEYGSSDIGRIFHWLLSTLEAFPYPVESGALPDYILLNTIKESLCHLDLDRKDTATSHRFSVCKQSGNGQSLHTFDLAASSEARVVASMAFFQLDLLSSEDRKPRNLRLMRRNTGDPEDPRDGTYLSETGRRYNRIGETEPEGEDEELEPETGVDARGVEPVIPLDEAILRSINTIANLDVRRRMQVNILLVGGGAKLPGLHQFLQNKLNTQVAGGVEVLKDCNREVGCDSVAWKGGAILAAMETAQELWIGREEWNRFGVKLLRERSLFSWA